MKLEDMVQFTKRWNWKWTVQHQGYFYKKLAATNVSSAPKYMCIFKTGLSSSYDDCAKYKEKVLDVSDPNENVEITCYSKVKFT